MMRDASLRWKIFALVALATVIALLLSAALIVRFQWLSQRAVLARELGLHAEVLGGASVAAIRFDSPRDAQRILESFEADARVTSARIYLPSHELFASFDAVEGSASTMERRETGEPSSREVGDYFDRDSITTVRAIKHDEDWLGTIAVTAGLDSMYDQLSRSVGAIAVSMATCLLLVLFLTGRWSRRLSRPIRHLADLATAVTQSRDYTLRAERGGNDELGALTDSFNEMLEQIRVRDDELNQAHTELKDWVTELKDTQERERELQQRLERSERMESLGLLAGGVAHDLNNMLGPIVGYPELMIAQLEEGDPMARKLELMKQSAVRAATIIQDLLALARRGSYAVEPLSLGQVIESYLSSPELEEQIKRYPSITIESNIAETNDAITGSGPHLCQLVMNLVLNALEALDGSGRVTLDLSYVTLEQEILGFDSIPPGRYAVFSVADDGPGIPHEDLSRIFEPFYSKKKMGHSGTGLGLAVVWGVAKDLDGHIDVETSAGSGTTFRAYFPVTGTLTESTPSDQLARGQERVLVVDDEPMQRDLSCHLLEHLGYEVVAVESGQRAVECLEQQDFDLVILDMVMEEGFDGLTTLRRILEKRPGQPCLIASGYSENERVAEALAEGAGAYLAKPFTQETLGTCVRKVLDSHLAEAVPVDPAPV